MRRLSGFVVVSLSVSMSCAPPARVDAGADATDAGGAFDGGATGDGGVVDGGSLDGGVVDGGLVDAGHDAGGGALAGFGVISGPCGVLDDELTENAPSFTRNAIDFGTDAWDDADYDALTAGGQEIIDDGNAGGSSLLSEVFAFEVLARCEGAQLTKTETEIVYTDAQGKITDLLVHTGGLPIGVSVTRAVAFPFDDPYTVAQARALLEQKLQGVLDSTANVTAADGWQKQILSVIAYAPEHADALAVAWAAIDASLRADTIVYVTVSNGDDGFLY